MKKVLAFLKKKDLYLVIARYSLGLSMLPYAISKLFREQFIVLPFTAWQMKLEELSGITLTWAFLGYSPWFQILLGVFELLPALLLLFRRTALLGAIMMLPMTLSVCLVNQAMNLWSSTKQISLILLLINLVVLIIEWKSLRNIVRLILNRASRLKFTGWENGVNMVILFVISYLLIAELLGYRRQQNLLIGDWLNNRPNEWILQSEKINDTLLPARSQKSYFSFFGRYNETGDSTVKNSNKEYSLDTVKHSLQFNDINEKTHKRFSYKMLDDTLMQLSRMDSSTNTTFTQIFKKRIINGRKN